MENAIVFQASDTSGESLQKAQQAVVVTRSSVCTRAREAEHEEQGVMTGLSEGKKWENEKISAKRRIARRLMLL